MAAGKAVIIAYLYKIMFVAGASESEQ